MSSLPQVLTRVLTFLYYLSLCLASNETVGKILVISENTINRNISSIEYTLTEYNETALGFPEGVSRCEKIPNTEYSSLNENECFDELEEIINFCQAAFVNVNDTDDTDGDITYTHYLSIIDVHVPYEDQLNQSLVYFNNNNACEPVMSIKREYENFEAILDRTLVGVYAKTCRSKTVCLQAYTRWLCSIKLNWATSNNTSKLPCANDENRSQWSFTDNGIGYYHIQPCLSICHEVLQRCPYFLPSEQQSTNTLIYGGYPAFDCPRDDHDSLQSCKKNSYSLCMNNEKGCCFGKSSTPSLISQLSVVFVLVILCLLMT